MYKHKSRKRQVKFEKINNNNYNNNNDNDNNDIGDDKAR